MSTDNEVYLVDHKVDRQKQIEAMDIGDTIAISRRIDLTFGIHPDQVRLHRKQLRGVLDTQRFRAAKKNHRADYQVEAGSFLTPDANLMLVVTITRME